MNKTRQDCDKFVFEPQNEVFEYPLELSNIDVIYLLDSSVHGFMGTLYEDIFCRI